MHTLRFDGETDDAFRARAERAATIAKVLVQAALRNACVQRLIADPAMPYTVESVTRSPTVRVEYEQAIAIGDLGTCLAATRNKYWGAGPDILPLEPEDEFHPFRVTYVYRTNSLYNRRFEQRIRLKELLGKRHRALVGAAKCFSKMLFLRQLTVQQAAAIRRILAVEPSDFWRACQGKKFIPLPGRTVQRTFDFEDQE